jgi:hypothetical protein
MTNRPLVPTVLTLDADAMALDNDDVGTGGGESFSFSLSIFTYSFFMRLKRCNLHFGRNLIFCVLKKRSKIKYSTKLPQTDHPAGAAASEDPPSLSASISVRKKFPEFVVVGGIGFLRQPEEFHYWESIVGEEGVYGVRGFHPPREFRFIIYY